MVQPFRYEMHARHKWTQIQSHRGKHNIQYGKSSMGSRLEMSRSPAMVAVFFARLEVMNPLCFNLDKKRQLGLHNKITRYLYKMMSNLNLKESKELNI